MKLRGERESYPPSATGFGGLNGNGKVKQLPFTLSLNFKLSKCVKLTASNIYCVIRAATEAYSKLTRQIETKQIEGQVIETFEKVFGHEIG